MTALRPGSPRWVHRHLPRIAPPDSWRSLRDARVPPVDYRDELHPSTMSPYACPLYLRPLHPKGGEELFLQECVPMRFLIFALALPLVALPAPAQTTPAPAAPTPNPA